nr:site-specific DNA-methyltransferase [Nocardioides thalensis]
MLRGLCEVPEYRREYRGKVRLIYIDPPFNTGQTFSHYDDWMEHSTWLSFMRDRLLLAKELLTTDGSIWIHLDDAEVHRMRMLMDEVFGASNFIATVVWQKVYSPKASARHLSVDQDYILIYANNAEAWRPNDLPRTAGMDAAYTNPDNDPRGPWKAGDLVANKPYSLGRYPITTPSGRVVDGPPPGRYWRVSEDRLRELDDDNRIWWGKDGANVPALKRFLTDVRGRVPQTLWMFAEVGHSQTAKDEIKRLFAGQEPFSTPKPERLLERVIYLGSQPGDVVLDCFGGSGTTAAVAHKMRRRWVTSEILPETVERFTRPRLEMVVKGEDQGGISMDVGWTGGGGFRSVNVAPSMYEVTPHGVMLAEWATNGRFARAVAGQLGFEWAPDGLFAGSRGRMRLAVFDGAVGEEEVRHVVGRLSGKERVTIVAQVVLPGAEELLAQLSRGSRIKKAPRDLLTEATKRFKRRLSEGGAK